MLKRVGARCGVMINPAVVEGQIAGGLAQVRVEGDRITGKVKMGVFGAAKVVGTRI